MNSRVVSVLLVGFCLSIQAAPILERLPSRALGSKIVDLTFFEHADFRGTQHKHTLPGTSTMCYNVNQGTPSFSSVRVNIPVEDPTCIVLFSKKECRGKKGGFVFTANSTLGELNDNVLSFRLCKDKELEHWTYQNFERTVPVAKNSDSPPQPELSFMVLSSTSVPEVTVQRNVL